MIVFWIALILAGVVIVAKKIRRQSFQCPSCSQRGVSLIRVVRFTEIDDRKLKSEKYAGYYLCRNCSARYKRHFGGKLESVSATEWAEHCAGRENRAA
jgi:hypothetical protein